MLKHSLLLALAAASAHGRGSQGDDHGSSSQKPMGVDYVCQHPQYQTRILSTSPLVIYIENFLTAEEREHLLDITKDTFAHSAVADEAGAQGQRQTRTSQSTNVPRDAVARCIEDRALQFQGYDVARAQLEPLQLVRYARGERFHFHTDWYAGNAATHASAALGGNRESSFFVYVAASNSSSLVGGERGGGGDLTGGGTNFPMLKPPRDPRWCALVDCDEPWEAGVTFRPVVGNAVFWRNVLGEEEEEDGAGDQRTLHAGLPVTSGWKVGMNIWTRQGPLSEEIRGPDV